jgi:predicted acylesterase/phospholipase RssA
MATTGSRLVLNRLADKTADIARTGTSRSSHRFGAIESSGCNRSVINAGTTEIVSGSGALDAFDEHYFISAGTGIGLCALGGKSDQAENIYVNGLTDGVFMQQGVRALFRYAKVIQTARNKSDLLTQLVDIGLEAIPDYQLRKLTRRALTTAGRTLRAAPRLWAQVFQILGRQSSHHLVNIDHLMSIFDDCGAYDDFIAHPSNKTIVITDVMTGRDVYIRNPATASLLRRAMRISMSIPAFTGPLPSMKGRIFCDGAYGGTPESCGNLPLMRAGQDGCDHVVIFMNAHPETLLRQRENLALAKTIHAYLCLYTGLLPENYEHANTVQDRLLIEVLEKGFVTGPRGRIHVLLIHPDKNDPKMLSSATDPAVLKANLEIGRRIGLEAMESDFSGMPAFESTRAKFTPPAKAAAALQAA